MPSPLTAESRDTQWHLPADWQAWRDKVRLPRSVARLLDDMRPAGEDKGEQLVFGALVDGLIKGIVLRRWAWVHATLGALLGRDAPSATCPHCGLEFVPPGAPGGAGRPGGRR